MNNWFEVGEEVIINCPRHPQHHNKDATILMIIGENEYAQDPFTGELFAPDGQLGIYMDDPLMKGSSGTICWFVSDLRKKHKPSDEGFKDMIQSLNKIKEIQSCQV